MIQKMFRFGFAVATLGLFAHQLAAQTGTTATILGNVTDASGAAVVNAKVTVISELTGFTRTVETQNDGSYTIVSLAIGTYDVTVEANGFERVEIPGIRLTINQTARVDTKLTVGRITETVTVSGERPVLKTDDSSTSQVYTGKAVENLPLNGRNFLEIGQLSAGANAGDSSYGQVLGSVNGQRSAGNQVQLDGIEVTEFSNNALRMIPSIDAIEEFTVQKGIYPAEYGKASGGTTNIAIRSGTNQLHGTAYDFLRNDKLDARNFFDVTGHPPNLRYNQFGGTLGGPIRKNKLFLFGSYEGVRSRNSGAGTGRIPDAQMIQGDLSGLHEVIQDPLTGSPFPNSVIPSSRINPISAGLAKLWPAPNNPSDPLRNYYYSGSGSRDADQFIGRGDYNLGSKDQIFLRYMYSKTDSADIPEYSGLADRSGDSPQSALAGYTRNLTPHIVNEARFGYTRIPIRYGRLKQYPDFAAQYNIPGVTRNPKFADIPDTSIAGWDAFYGGVTRPYFITQNNFEFTDNIMIQHGAHSIKLGVDTVRRQAQQLVPLIKKGLFSFSGQFTGDGLADFLLGDLASSVLGSSPYDVTAANYRTRETFPYIQDDWRVSPRLTLNLGLRYEYWGPPSDLRGTAVNFDPLTKQFNPKPFTPNAREVNADKNNFAPRFGFAFRPLQGLHTVIRGGYGVFYTANNYDAYYYLPYNPPFGNVISYSSLPDQPTLTLANPFPSSGTSGGPPGAFGVDRNLKIGYVQTWSLSIQQEILPATVLEIGYLGNKGTKLDKGINANYAVPGPGPIQPRRILSQDYGDIGIQTSTSNASYEALQVHLERQLTGGLLLLSSYTFGKALDDVSNSNGDRGGFQGQDPRCPNSCEKGRPGIDITQRFTLAAVYQLPFGRGRKFAGNMQKLPNLALGGWDLSSILIIQSGNPFNIYLPYDNLNIGQSNPRPDYIGGNVRSDHPTINQWFNTDVFASPAPYTPGNAGRGLVDGPGSTVWNCGVHKDFNIHESHKLQFRGEFFNLPNHTNFGMPGGYFGLPSFGVIGSAGYSREGQLALKYMF
jgi:Carboxypeptidase regulatory-like domain/TonB-dependent Receptor Plug Domain